MKKSNKRIKHERGRRISIYIKKDVSDELLRWLNSQVDVGPSIINVIERYVKDELISVDVLRRIQLNDEEGRTKRVFDTGRKDEVKTLGTKAIANSPIITEEDAIIESIVDDKGEVTKEMHETTKEEGDQLIEDKKDLKDESRPPLVGEFEFLNGEAVKKSRFGDKK